MEPLLSGCGTLRDRELYHHVLDLYETEEIEVEPSAAAGCAIPDRILSNKPGRRYLQEHSLDTHMPRAVHVVWATGGLFIPAEQHERFRAMARK
jgi:D-serine dehydratase